MTDEANELPPELSASDPVLGDPPPWPGSSRYLAILERAMSTTEPPAGEPSSNPRSLRAWPTRVLVAAAAIVVLAVGAVLVRSIGTTTPASATEQLESAARKTGDVTTLRVHGVYTDSHSDGSHDVTTLESEVDGTDYYSVFARSGTPGRPSSTQSETVIGGRSWESVDGHVTEKPAGPPSSHNAPFPIASRSVVSAALTGSVVDDLGKAKVRGVQTRHFTITLTAASRRALGALPENQLSAFELEGPQSVKSFDVWVADGLIHKISVLNSYGENVRGPGSADVTTSSTSVVEFFDFGSVITIRRPS